MAAVIDRIGVLAVAAAVLGGVGCGGGAEAPPVELLEDAELMGFPDGDTSLDPASIRLSDFFASSRPGTRILMINAAAGWCVPCMREAEAMSQFAATYLPQGVAIVTDIFQDQNGDPADVEFVRAWSASFELTIPQMIDDQFVLGQYLDANTMPANMFVDAETREILLIATGAETGDDPMREYRDVLDFYLAE